jgi:hypothetical protein
LTIELAVQVELIKNPISATVSGALLSKDASEAGKTGSITVGGEGRTTGADADELA